MIGIELRVEDPGWRDVGLEGLARDAFGATAAHLRLDGAIEVSLLGCDDLRIVALNADFRAKSAPTNVLSWPSEHRAPAQAGDRPTPPRGDPHFPGEPVELGDIAIALQTCTREAGEQGKPLRDHVTHLLVHGFLHLLGYDHIRDADATLMEATEVEILGKMGLPDPY